MSEGDINHVAGWRSWVPGLETLRSYRREWLRRDLAAGLMLTAMMVPVEDKADAVR